MFSIVFDCDSRLKAHAFKIINLFSVETMNKRCSKKCIDICRGAYLTEHLQFVIKWSN